MLLNIASVTDEFFKIPLPDPPEAAAAGFESTELPGEDPPDNRSSRNLEKITNIFDSQEFIHFL
jgi:hypothetical protein